MKTFFTISSDGRYKVLKSPLILALRFHAWIYEGLIASFFEAIGVIFNRMIVPTLIFTAFPVVMFFWGLIRLMIMALLGFYGIQYLFS